MPKLFEDSSENETQNAPKEANNSAPYKVLMPGLPNGVEVPSAIMRMNFYVKSILIGALSGFFSSIINTGNILNDTSPFMIRTLIGMPECPSTPGFAVGRCGAFPPILITLFAFAILFLILRKEILKNKIIGFITFFITSFLVFFILYKLDIYFTYNPFWQINP